MLDSTVSPSTIISHRPSRPDSSLRFSMWLVCHGGVAVVVWKVTPGLLLPGVEKHAEQRFLNKASTVMMQHAESEGDIVSLALDSTLVQGPLAQW